MLRARHPRILFLCLVLAAAPAAAQSCTTGPEMEAPLKSALESTALQIFQAAAGGNLATLRGSLAPTLNANLLETAVNENKGDLTGATGTLRAVFLLDAGNLPQTQTVEFFCGVVNTSRYTAFRIEDLVPGRYAYALVDGAGGKGPIMMSQVLQEIGGQWKLAGFVLRPASLGGHDGFWYLGKARDFGTKGQRLDAWFYYLTAWRLTAPVDFMSTPNMDKLSTEVQAARPPELPTRDQPLALVAGGKTYPLIDMFAAPAADALHLVVKYQVPSVADPRQAYQNNLAVIKAVVVRFPELREAFSGVVARAVAPSGEDYGTLLPMKDVK